MKNSKSLQKQSKNIFIKIYNFFRTIFFNKKKANLINDFEDSKQKEYKDDFIKNIELKENEADIISLKKKFDDEMIDVKEISIRDKIELLEMYKKEILENKKYIKK